MLCCPGPRLTVYVGDDPTLTALLSMLGLLGMDDVGWWPDYSDRLVFELWGPAEAGAPSLPQLLTSLDKGQVLTGEEPNCKLAPQFVVRLYYVRVEPMSSQISKHPLTLSDCEFNCPLST